MINENMINELHKVTPKYNYKDSISRYLSLEIKKLQLLKKKLLSLIHKLNRKFITNGEQITILKRALEHTRQKLKKTFDKKVNEY